MPQCCFYRNRQTHLPALHMKAVLKAWHISTGFSKEKKTSPGQYRKRWLYWIQCSPKASCAERSEAPIKLLAMFPWGEAEVPPYACRAEHSEAPVKSIGNVTERWRSAPMPVVLGTAKHLWNYWQCHRAAGSALMPVVLQAQKHL